MLPSSLNAMDDRQTPISNFPIIFDDQIIIHLFFHNQTIIAPITEGILQLDTALDVEILSPTDKSTLLLDDSSDLIDITIRANGFADNAQTRMVQMRNLYPLVADYGMDPDDPDTWPLLAANGDLAGLLGRRKAERTNSVHLRVLGQTGGVDTETNSLETGLGLKIQRSWKTDFGRIVPEISAMWMHELLSPWTIAAKK